MVQTHHTDIKEPAGYMCPQVACVWAQKLHLNTLRKGIANCESIYLGPDLNIYFLIQISLHFKDQVVIPKIVWIEFLIYAISCIFSLQI